jgi:type VII secretion integral membrane protein EccD
MFPRREALSVTLPSSLSELDSEPDEEQELSRITVLVGELLVDVGLPSRVSISALVYDVIELANDQLPVRSDVAVEFDNTEGKWTFARLAGSAIEPDRSLAEAGVYDGELLVVREAGIPASSVLVDDVEGRAESVEPGARWFTEHGSPATWFALSFTFAAAAALLLLLRDRSTTPTVAGIPITGITTLLLGIGCTAAACVLPYRSGDPRRSAWLGGVALPLVFGGSMRVVPDGHGLAALPMALALTALAALLQLIVTGRGRTQCAAVIALALFGAPAGLAQLLLNPNPRAVGAILATVAVMVVYLAPRVTILLSRLPVPPVPTAGEPLDDIETQGGTAVEGVNAIGKQVIPTEKGMADRVRRAREYLTGIVAAAAVLAVVGCYQALGVGDGFFWQGTAFAVAVATVLSLRGRSHHDLTQSAVLIGGGLVIALLVIAKTGVFVQSWQADAAVALVALTALLVLLGLVAPRREFSPVMRRCVEIFENLAIASVFPLAFSIIQVYAFVRELQV